jgi:syntaxin-binding protein 5
MLAGISSHRLPVSKLINSATYGTFFDIRRANTLPDIDFSTSRGTVPSQPQPVTLGPGIVVLLQSDKIRRTD